MSKKTIKKTCLNCFFNQNNICVEKNRIVLKNDTICKKHTTQKDVNKIFTTLEPLNVQYNIFDYITN